MAALENAAPIPRIFGRMIDLLKQMHDATRHGDRSMSFIQAVSPGIS
jgi:hypothetical protein